MSMTAVGSTYAAMVGIETFMKSRGKIRKLKEGFGSLTLRIKTRRKRRRRRVFESVVVRAVIKGNALGGEDGKGWICKEDWDET